MERYTTPNKTHNLSPSNDTHVPYKVHTECKNANSSISINCIIHQLPQYKEKDKIKYTTVFSKFASLKNRFQKCKCDFYFTKCNCDCNECKNHTENHYRELGLYKLCSYIVKDIESRSINGYTVGDEDRILLREAGYLFNKCGGFAEMKYQYDFELDNSKMYIPPYYCRKINKAWDRIGKWVCDDTDQSDNSLSALEFSAIQFLTGWDDMTTNK